MIQCYISNCTMMPDPLSHYDTMNGLTTDRVDKILRLKNEADRKRSLMAGIMIRDNLLKCGFSQDDILISDNGRPYIDGIDFNVSHSGDYVVMVISDEASVGCDIELMRDRSVSPAQKYFSDAEKAWIDSEADKIPAFYRIWTARESYIKLTGEGILLDFSRYEVNMSDAPGSMDAIGGDIIGATPMGVAEVVRDGERSACVIYQWIYDKEYVISVCRRNASEDK